VATAPRTLPEEREGTAGGLFAPEAQEVPRIAPAELTARLAGDAPPIVLDVRSRGQFEQDDGQIPGSVRVLPDRVGDWAATASRERAVVAYCT
jgi:rhodanese-related sulfurtransferase